jgi:hypothetical protein
VSLIFPSLSESACIACNWSHRDWDAISNEFSCNCVIKSPPTRSPAHLGAADAATAAELLERYIAGTLVQKPAVAHHFMSMSAHKAWLTHVVKNAACRASHNRWNVEGGASTVLTSKSGALSLPGLPFVRRLVCSCGATRPLFFVAARLGVHQTRCPSCGRDMYYGALDLADEIHLSELGDFGPEKQALALADIGVVDRDIIRVGDSYFEFERQRAEQTHG